MIGLWVARLLCPLLVIGLIVGSLWAQEQQALWIGLRALAEQPWGLVTLLDLAGGLGLMAVWMIRVEGLRSLLWVILLPLFGNMTSLAWVSWRCWRAASLGDALGLQKSR